MPDRKRYGRTPDAVLMLALCASLGTLQVVTLELPDSVLDRVPLAWGVFWAVTFALAAGVSLVALYWHDEVEGWLLELAGRATLAGTAGAYTWALGSSVDGLGSWLVVGFVGGITAASVWRAGQVFLRLRRYRRDLQGAT